MENAPLFIDFQLNNILKQKNNFKSPQEKAQYVKQIIPILAEIKNRIIRSEYIDMVAQSLSIDANAIRTEMRVFERANLPQAERIVKNVTKNSSVLQKAQKNLLSVFLVPDSPLTFTQINEMIVDVAFDDEILINVKSTIDKLICSVNNVKELIEHLYTEFVDNPDAQAVLPELIATSEVYRGLEEEDFVNVIRETLNKIIQCRQAKETEHIKNLYKGISDDDPEALKLQIQLRDKIKKFRQKSEKF
jgi:DNA primase